MNREETILFLQEATASFQRLKAAADACIKHANECSICRSRLKSVFWHCHDKDGLSFDWLTAKVDAQHFQTEMKNLTAAWQKNKPKSTAKVVRGTPTVEWIMNLYELPDDRE